MTDPIPPQAPPGGAEFAEMARLTQEMFAKALENPSDVMRKLDPLNVGGTMADAATRMHFDPARLVQANIELWQQHMLLWQRAAQKMAGQPAEPVATPERGDRRFRDAEWESNALFDYIKQSYLITSRWLVATMGAVQGLDARTARKMDFYTRQFADAFAPSNFAWTNPEVLRAMRESQGQSLVRGYENFRRDLERGGGQQLQITMTDASAFELGRNIAVTPGKVVFQNDLVQLIQFSATTAEVHERPLLIVPPWINKYYILDLTAEKSFIRWAVERGYTVFVVSWVNPDTRLSEKSFDDYMTEGVLAAVDAVTRATGVPDMSAIGYCIGGTMLAATLGYMAAKGDERIRAVTFFATQVDFSDPGDLQVFIDEKQLDNLDSMMAEKGYLDGQAMFSTFNMLRANDLFWSFYVNNYLLGKDPAPFDLLYWNADATRMPRKAHMLYLREMYLKNSMAKGELELAGERIDLTKVTMPVYLLASREDHIAPYPSVFKASHLYSGPVRFVLAGSGHIAGVINPPDQNKYQYWVNPAQDGHVGELADWLGGADEHKGSWWPDWDAWLAPQSGKMVPARTPGDGGLKVIEDAPGAYVKMRS